MVKIKIVDSPVNRRRLLGCKNPQYIETNIEVNIPAAAIHLDDILSPRTFNTDVSETVGIANQIRETRRFLAQYRYNVVRRNWVSGKVLVLDVDIILA